MKAIGSYRQRSLPLLIAGDVGALLLWVMVGLATHEMYSNLLFNVARVATPFLIGWFAVAPFTGAYDLSGASRAPFLRRSALTWLAGTCLGLFLRATLFHNGFVPIFAAVTLVVTALLVLGWRTAFAFLLNR
jgi:hypothetical protein